MRFKSCAVWFDDAIPMRCQLNNAPLIEARFPVHSNKVFDKYSS